MRIALFCTLLKDLNELRESSTTPRKSRLYKVKRHIKSAYILNNYVYRQWNEINQNKGCLVQVESVSLQQLKFHPFFLCFVLRQELYVRKV